MDIHQLRHGLDIHSGSPTHITVKSVLFFSSLPLFDHPKHDITSHHLNTHRSPPNGDFSQVKPKSRSAPVPAPRTKKPSNIESQLSTLARANPGSGSRDIQQRLQRRGELLLVLVDDGALVIDDALLNARDVHGGLQFPMHLGAVAVAVAIGSPAAVLAPRGLEAWDRVPQGRDLEPDCAERVLHPVRRGRDHGWGTG